MYLNARGDSVVQTVVLWVMGIVLALAVFILGAGVVKRLAGISNQFVNDTDIH